MNKDYQTYQGSGNKYNMEINRLKNLEDLERLRNEVNMDDDEYNIIKNVINGKDETYNSPNLSHQEIIRSARRSFNIILIKLSIVFVIIVGIVISLIWNKLSIIEAQKRHPFNFHSAPALCGMRENEFKINLETADSKTLNNAINELDNRLKFLESLDREPLHIKNEKNLINDRLRWLKNRLSELEK